MKKAFSLSSAGQYLVFDSSDLSIETIELFCIYVFHCFWIDVVVRIYPRICFCRESISKNAFRWFESVYRPEMPENLRILASQSRRRRVWNQGEALYGIRNLLRYGIITKWCMSSIRRENTRYRVMPYACGDSIHDCVVITYQSFGLDRKKQVLRLAFFCVVWQI